MAIFIRHSLNGVESLIEQVDIKKYQYVSLKNGDTFVAYYYLVFYIEYGQNF